MLLTACTGNRHLACLVFLSLALGLSRSYGQQYNTAKPWTYWWWMGSAVTREDLTWQMERFAAKGLGGVHIIPIYGVKGYEQQAIPFLSTTWLQMLEHTLREGKRLGLGVDMTTGTGWPFGGPNVTSGMAARKWTLNHGQVTDAPTGQKVKRAAPGGEGPVLDPFGPEAMRSYTSRFDSAFKAMTELPRAMYNDSYEVYGANWTTTFPSEFRKRRGYDFSVATKLLADSVPATPLARIDYLQTLSELLLENYARAWTGWSRSRGMRTRYQAHGSPGNLLDLYAEADIPETESFGTSKFPIPGLRVDPDYEEDRFGRPDPLAMKMASSPAHLLGKKLVSSESTTWLANHFKVSLSQIKPQLDELFTAGINHIFFHGTTYTPRNEPFPGWLFYASTNYGPHAHFDNHLPLLNSYITRCQQLLQESAPDNEILLYFPLHDLWAEPGTAPEAIRMLDVHHTEKWLARMPVGQLAKKLWQNGYTFDYVSDTQLARLKPDGKGGFTAGGAAFRVLLVPAATYFPEHALEELHRLARAGIPVIFDGKLPERVTGHKDNGQRQKIFNARLTQLTAGGGKATVSENLEKTLEAHGIFPEALAGAGLNFIRKIHKSKPLYFTTNLSDRFEKGWLPVNRILTNPELLDPLTGETSPLPIRKSGNRTEVYLDLPPGTSAFLYEAEHYRTPGKAVTFSRDVQLRGEWTLDFIKGLPKLPAGARLQALTSWTSLPDSAAFFSGTARYRLRFDRFTGLPEKGRVMLDLGDVREVAEVTLNGHPLGTAWCIPFRLSFDASLFKDRDNLLEIRVTNLSANYMRVRDGLQPDWKKFYDINMADITYRPFRAANWPAAPSGLLTPVRIRY